MLDQAFIYISQIVFSFLFFADKVDRPVSTAIYYLLPSGSISKLHRLPAAEVWHFYTGQALTVSLSSCPCLPLPVIFRPR